MSKRSDTPSERLPANLAASDLSRPPEFSLEQRRILLRIAHEAILSGVERRELADEPPTSPLLSERRGVFTTLYLKVEHLSKVRRELRGCVGYPEPIAALYRAVAETARAAALDDSRFSPVTKEEASQLEVSLSVLSRLFPIHPEAVEVGRHGLVISRESRRGLLLPQVPVEFAWDRETFLEQTCRKAGLPVDCWRRDATIEAFTAEVFSDADVEVPG